MKGIIIIFCGNRRLETYIARLLIQANFISTTDTRTIPVAVALATIYSMARPIVPTGGVDTFTIAFFFKYQNFF